LLYLFTDPTTRKRAVDAEMTYSNPYHSGIAKRVGVDEATVAAYMAEVVDAYGQSVTEPSLPSALAEYVAENLSRDHSFVMDRVLCGAGSR